MIMLKRAFEKTLSEEQYRQASWNYITQFRYIFKEVRLRRSPGPL